MKLVGIAWLALLAATTPTLAEYTPKICEDAGGFVVGQEALDFEDIAVEGIDAINFNETGPITAYGYVVQIRMGSGLDEPVRFKIGAIKKCAPSMRTLILDATTLVDVAMARSSFSSDDEWKAARRSVLKADGGMFTPVALVKVSGSFGISATDSLVLSAEAVEVIESWK